MKKKQSVTSDREDISEDFVKMASYGCNADGRVATPEYKAIHRAWNRAEISGWKLMSSPRDERGCIFVNKVEADALLRARACRLSADAVEASQSVPATQDALDDAEVPLGDAATQHAVVALCQINGTMMDLLYAVDRVAAACESMASAWGAKQQEKDVDTVGLNVFDS